MTAAKRQQRRRTRIRDAVASLSPERRFRRDVLSFVETYRALQPKLSAGAVAHSVWALANAIDIGEFSPSEQRQAFYHRKGWEPTGAFSDSLYDESKA